MDDTHEIPQPIEARTDLIESLYPQLRRLAHRQRWRSSPGDTLGTTALVHEAYLKLGARDRSWRDRGHFFAAASQAMRHLLVDAARRRLCTRHGGGREAETLDESLAVEPGHALEVLAVDQALERLRLLDERLCRVVECRFFAGLTEEETGVALGVSGRTVHRDWLRARSWLRKELGRGSFAGGAEP